MLLEDLKRSFVRQFMGIGYNRNRWEVFSDFIFLASYAFQQSVFFDADIEDKYMRIIKKYSREDAFKFAELLGLLRSNLPGMYCDFLGSIYMELDLGNDHLGQFFTPYDINRLMARICGTADAVSPGGRIIANDPAAGASGMLIAVFETALESGIDAHNQILVVGVDIDALAARMGYLQLCIMGIPANIVIGNTLTVEYREALYTPAFFRYGWHRWLSEGNQPERVDVPKPGQMALCF